jgi:hypothetical protein
LLSQRADLEAFPQQEVPVVLVKTQTSQECELRQDTIDVEVNQRIGVVE